jgi:hypothetical protein
MSYDLEIKEICNESGVRGLVLRILVLYVL